MARAAVIAFAGFRGAGKTTLARRLAEELQCERVSFGDEVRKIADKRGLSADLGPLLDLGAQEVATRPDAFCRDVLMQTTSWSKRQTFIIDGVRHLKILQILTSLVHPLRLILIYVDPDDATRKLRLSERNDQLNELFTGHEIENELPQLKLAADLVVAEADSVSSIIALLEPS